MQKNQAITQVRVVEAILRQWDPIGVMPGEMAPADEYDSYAPHIVSLVVQGCSVECLESHLRILRTETIGVKGNPKRDTVAANKIVSALRNREE